MTKAVNLSARGISNGGATPRFCCVKWFVKQTKALQRQGQSIRQPRPVKCGLDRGWVDWAILQFNGALLVGIFAAQEDRRTEERRNVASAMQ